MITEKSSTRRRRAVTAELRRNGQLLRYPQLHPLEAPKRTMYSVGYTASIIAATRVADKPRLACQSRRPLETPLTVHGTRGAIRYLRREGTAFG